MRWKRTLWTLCIVWVLVLFEVVNTFNTGEPGFFASVLRSFGEITLGQWIGSIAMLAAIGFGMHVWLRRGHVSRKERKERAKRRAHPDT